MLASEFLTRAQSLINAGWSKNYYARDKDGLMCNVDSPAACQFCAMGALQRVWHLSDYEETGYILALGYLGDVVGAEEIVTWNDTASDKATVILGFSKAIKLAKEREAQ